MKIQPTDKYNSNFGITTKFKINYYAPNCWNEISDGKFKDYNFKVYNNYIDGEHSSTLIIFKKFNKWIKSKLKYMLGDERKVLWSYAKDSRGAE